jgi:transcriptional regulator with XRE-family HTH domain
MEQLGQESQASKPSGRHLGAVVRGARAAQGMTLAELGRRIGYSAAQVSRYERGLVPLTDITLLRRFAAALDISPQILGLAPSGISGQRPLDAQNSGDQRPGSVGECVTPYADRGLVTREQWNRIIRGATRELWLYGMAEYGYAIDADVPSILQQATARGCRVRVLLLNPGSAVSAAIDQDEGHPPGTLAARTRAALARFGAMRRRCGPGMRIRVYDEHPTVSVVRGDDAMLVTPYMRFFIGSNSPTFEFKAREAPKIFARYTRHFAATWTNAEDWHQ